jgi:hypothetical protein
MSFSLLTLTFILFGGAAVLMGNAIADTWRPWWQNVVYGFLLAVADEFLGFALFGGPFFVDSLVSSDGGPFWPAFLAYLVDAVIISAISLFAYRVTLARKMVTQYPWLYERAGLLGWREKARA